MKQDRNGPIEVKCAYTDMVDIGSVKPHPKNPNRHPPKQVALLARMIRRVGMRQPITVSNLSGYVVRGHERVPSAEAGCGQTSATANTGGL